MILLSRSLYTWCSVMYCFNQINCSQRTSRKHTHTVSVHYKACVAQAGIEPTTPSTIDERPTIDSQRPQHCHKNSRITRWNTILLYYILYFILEKMFHSYRSTQCSYVFCISVLYARVQALFISVANPVHSACT